MLKSPSQIRLEALLSDLTKELNNISWTFNDGVIQGSLNKTIISVLFYPKKDFFTVNVANFNTKKKDSDNFYNHPSIIQYIIDFINED